MSRQEAFTEIDRRSLLLLTIAFEGGMLIVAAACAWWFGIPLWPRPAPKLGDVAVGIGAALAMGAIVAGMNTVPWRLLRRVQEDFRLILTVFRHATALDLAIISLLAGLGEEALFRGVMQPLVSRYTGELGGLLAVSALFGLAHAVSASYAVFATLIGIFLGWLYLWTGTLTAPAIAHGLYDFLALAYGVNFVLPAQAESG